MPISRRGPTHDIPLLDIRLDDDVLVFRGAPDESSGALLSGSLALCITNTASIRSITLVLQGIRKLNWSERIPPPVSGLIASNGRTVKHEDTFFEKKWTMLEDQGKMTAMKPGNYEYPFDASLTGQMCESIEGLGHAYVIWRLKARVVRGTFSHDITAKKHLRIVRTLAPESLELAQTMNVENLWPNKVDYSISVPSKAIVFGTHIPIDIVLVPLLKGLTIGNVICSLKEISTLTCPAKGNPKVETRHICSQTFTSGTMETDNEEELGRWVMHERVVLPKSLNSCVQDCDVPFIKIRHKLKFTIQLHNPDGHMSELRASLPVMLFISPNYLMDSNNQIPVDAACPSLESDNAPPRYDEHYLDQLYSQILPATFETPLPSGANTPGVLSRTPSFENLTTHSSPLPLRLPDASSMRWTSRMPPTATITPPSEQLDYFSAGSSRAPSPDLDLSRVPSYNTAVASSARIPDTAELPFYDRTSLDIQSAPTSPQHSPPRRRPGTMRSHTMGGLRDRERRTTGLAGGDRPSGYGHLHSLWDGLRI